MKYLPPKACPNCNRTYWPESEVQMYCKRCGKRVAQISKQIRKRKEKLKAEREADMEHLSKLYEEGLL